MVVQQTNHAAKWLLLRPLLVYGIPILVLIVFAGIDIAVALGVPIVWMFVFHFLTERLEEYDHARDLLHTYHTRAAHGDAQAMFAIAVALETGHGCRRDPVQSLNWYLKAAAAGSGDAMYEAYCCYRDGTGTPPDTVKAQMWLMEAAASGDEMALSTLRHPNSDQE
jgi:hypothetical protein